MKKKNDVDVQQIDALNSNEMRACPSCAEQIPLRAKKCKHCGEFVEAKAPRQKLSNRIVATIGLFTACLSVFYALREGYFYIEQKQQQRAALESYIKVASHFEQLDTLNYAQQALTKALSLSPNNTNLQRRLFVLRAQDLLREIDRSGPNPENRQLVEELILDGHRLLTSDLAGNQRAQLLVMVARLLPQDMLWNDTDGVTDLFARAFKLSPDKPEVAFRYGQWLIDADLDKTRGIELIIQAIKLAPNDALYPYELAKIRIANGDYSLALPLLLNAIELLPKQRELQRIRASNFSKAELRKLLIRADEAYAIEEDQFLELDKIARRQLLEQVLATRPTDRILNFMAARLYFSIDELELAETAISKTVSEGDLVHTTRGYYLDEFALYRDILERSNSNPAKLKEIKQALAHYQEALSYEEALEVGVEGGHRYKIGLRISKADQEAESPGLEVIEAYSGYPFARAQVQAGDRILSLAHRQPNTVMSIYNILSNFKPGASVPLLIDRRGQQLELELVVE